MEWIGRRVATVFVPFESLDVRETRAHGLRFADRSIPERKARDMLHACEI